MGGFVLCLAAAVIGMAGGVTACQRWHLSRIDVRRMGGMTGLDVATEWVFACDPKTTWRILWLAMWPFQTIRKVSR